MAKSLNIVVFLTSSDQMFIQRSETQQNAATVAGSQNVIIESHVGNASASESTRSSDSHLKPPIFHYIYLLMLYYQIHQNRIEENGQILPECANVINHQIEQQLQLPIAFWWMLD